MGEDQFECAGTADWLLRNLSLRAGAMSFAVMHPICQGNADDKQAGRDQHHAVRANWLEQPTCGLGTKNSAKRTSYTDDCKQPPALFLRVYVVRKRPKLCNDDEVEKANPQEENNSKWNLHLPQRVKDHQIGYEKRDHAINQSQPVYTACDGAISRNEKQQEQG